MNNIIGNSENPGIFPDCGCHYTIDDDGIHFCDFHLNAEKIVNELKEENQRLKMILNEARLDQSIPENRTNLWNAIEAYETLTQ